jgi:hypothetical protein
MSDYQFVVDGAGCESCAERVRSAVAPLVTVESITIDESTDTATVVVRAESPPSVDAIDAALADASTGSGHAYRVQRRSFRLSV